MSTKEINKELIITAKKLLKEKGYEVKNSHLYDVFAQLSGHKNWHIASKKNQNLTEILNQDLINKSRFNLDLSFLKAGDDIPFTFFDNRLPAWNMSIAGQTGSGKSILLKKMINNEVNKDPNLVVRIYNQNEKEYSNFAKSLGGKSINFTPDCRYSINFFEINPNKSYPNKEKKNIIKQLLTKYSVDENKIDNLIYNYYMSIYNENLENRDQVFKKIFKFNITSEIKSIISLKEGDCEPMPYGLLQLKMILDSFVPENYKILKNKNGLDKIMDEFLKDVYNQVGNTYSRYPSISDFFLYLRDEKLDPYFQKVKECLNRNDGFIKFGYKTDKVFDEKILSISFKGLEQNNELYGMYKQIVVLFLDMKLKSLECDVRKINAFDDIWEASPKSNWNPIFHNILGTSRRNNIGNISCVQSLSDYYMIDENEGRGILKNFQKIVQGKTNSKITDIFFKKEFGFIDEDLELFEKYCGISHSTEGTGFLLIHEYILSPFRLKVTPTEYNKFTDY
jgi:hypothetical protein